MFCKDHPVRAVKGNSSGSLVWRSHCALRAGGGIYEPCGRYEAVTAVWLGYRQAVAVPELLSFAAC